MAWLGAVMLGLGWVEDQVCGGAGGGGGDGGCLAATDAMVDDGNSQFIQQSQSRVEWKDGIGE